jgi:hypothetical protein
MGGVAEERKMDGDGENVFLVVLFVDKAREDLPTR